MKKQILLILSLVTVLALSACGSSKKSVAMSVASDPLGAYALMQIKYKKEQDSDWIFLGPTPVITQKALRLDGATSVTLKVIRPGFYDQEKTWKAKDFLKEYKRDKKISWIPALVKE